MKYDLVKSNSVVQTHDFGDSTPPILATHKGKWLPQLVISPPFDRNTQKQTRTVTINANDVTYKSSISDKSPAELAVRTNHIERQKLAALDLASIRDLREWVASQPTAPQSVKDREALAVATRGRIV